MELSRLWSLRCVTGLAALAVTIGACTSENRPTPNDDPPSSGVVAEAADPKDQAEQQNVERTAPPGGSYGSVGPVPSGEAAQGEAAIKDDEGVSGLSQEQPAEENPGESDPIPEPPVATRTSILIEVTEAKLTPADPEPNDEFGWSLGIFEDLLISGAPLADDNGGNSGTAYIFRWNGVLWEQAAKLTAVDGAEGDWFGKSAAISGDYAVVGANLDDGPMRNGFYDDDTGSAYVFARSEGFDGEEVWRQQAKLRADLQIEWAEFGFDVEIDGDTIAVAAYNDPTLAVDAGAVYVFRRQGQEWLQEAILLPSEGAAGDEFGLDIALSGDTILVGAHGDDGRAQEAGAAYVYRRRGDVWVEEAILRPPEGAAFDQFGWSVALDGDQAIVGAPFEDGVLSDSGIAYIFERRGTDWSEAIPLKASDAFQGAWFGRAVAIAGDYALIGAPRYDRIILDNIPNEIYNFGVSYIFQHSAEGWVQIARILADDPDDGDDFGWTVAMTPRVALVGAWLDDTEAGPDAGSVYAYILPR